MRRTFVALVAVAAILGSGHRALATHRCYQTAGAHWYCPPDGDGDCVVGQVRGLCSAGDVLVDAFR